MIWKLSCVSSMSVCYQQIDGILPKGPYPPCIRMADRALLAGYPRNTLKNFVEFVICTGGSPMVIFMSSVLNCLLVNAMWLCWGTEDVFHWESFGCEYMYCFNPWNITVIQPQKLDIHFNCLLFCCCCLFFCIFFSKLKGNLQYFA